MPVPILPGGRVLLRPWREADREPFAAMNADPRVMAYFPQRLDRAESDALFDRIAGHFAEHGFGPWALELPDLAPFIGFAGLAVPRFHERFTPCVEIAWRLAFAQWGRGYATEAARLALAQGFGPLGLAEVVSFTPRGNQRSRAVMARLGMTHDPAGDFDHPALPRGHRLRRHVLFRLAAADFRAGGG
ncbi:MAG: GNAT family N-acetyltransferase [Dongiaceae bacterium]